MNELFVNIKVDREERPDVDAIYMDAVQAMTGQGGWPMTVFLTPDGRPFFGGTYFPKTGRGGDDELHRPVPAHRRGVAHAPGRDERTGRRARPRPSGVRPRSRAPPTTTLLPCLSAALTELRRARTTRGGAASAARRSSRRP